MSRKRYPIADSGIVPVRIIRDGNQVVLNMSEGGDECTTFWDSPSELRKVFMRGIAMIDSIESDIEEGR